jgi:hypothetical protein
MKMIMLRRTPILFLFLALALALSACATTSAPPGGAAIARLTPEALARLLPKPEPKLPPAELARLSQEGAAPQDIIAKIRQTGSSYALSAAQLIELHDQGVSTQVLDYIQSAREQELRASLVDEINQREQRHAEELKQQREQEQQRSYNYDPWWPGYPGYGWPYPFRPYGGFYWRR